MAHQLTVDDARQSLTAHVGAKGFELHQKYGPRIGWNELKRILLDPAFVRYPCELAFDGSQLQPGEFACPLPKGEHPSAGFVIAIHPHFALRLDEVPALVLYQLVAVNYGEFASADDAETFGAAALGIEKEAYYQFLCERADEIAA